jgi:hypothetical protein
MSLRLNDLPAAPRDLAMRSLDWLDARCDPTTGLFRAPGNGGGRFRESVWVAQGLLLRDGEDDRERAAGLVSRALEAQMRAPGQPWDGTFARFDGEPAPREGARAWIDYDPNWRQFLGAAFALMLREHATLLPAPLIRRMEDAIEIARTSESAERVSHRYTNIALLKSWLEVEAGDPRGLELAREILEGFRVHDSFDEYGSPTYYGIDLYALALWRTHSRASELRDWGAMMWDALWRDIARFYHAGLRNLAGPYTRSYGMDLRRYAATLGLWVWAGIGGERAPFPDPRRPFDHSHDFALAPSVALLSARLEEPIPDDARLHLERFQGERLVERLISESPSRRATAWLAEDLAIGAESSEVDWHGFDQHHPATLHWRIPEAEAEESEQVGWLRVRHDGPVDARAEVGALSLALSAPQDRSGGETRLEFFAPGGRPDSFANPDLWKLPGLTLRVETDASSPSLEGSAPSMCVRYPGPGPRIIRLAVEDRGR